MFGEQAFGRTDKVCLARVADMQGMSVGPMPLWAVISNADPLLILNQSTALPRLTKACFRYPVSADGPRISLSENLCRPTYRVNSSRNQVDRKQPSTKLHRTTQKTCASSCYMT